MIELFSQLMRRSEILGAKHHNQSLFWQKNQVAKIIASRLTSACASLVIRPSAHQPGLRRLSNHTVQIDLPALTS